MKKVYQLLFCIIIGTFLLPYLYVDGVSLDRFSVMDVYEIQWGYLRRYRDNITENNFVIMFDVDNQLVSSMYIVDVVGNPLRSDIYGNFYSTRLLHRWLFDSEVEYTVTVNGNTSSVTFQLSDIMEEVDFR